MIHRITVTDQTTPEDMDNFFSHAWRSENRVRLTFDVRHCRNISLKRAARMKSVLEKHRARSLKYIEESVISYCVNPMTRQSLFSSEVRFRGLHVCNRMCMYARIL